MALAIYQTILFIIIGITIWLMIKPQRIPLNLSKTAKRVLLVPACFVAMFLVLGIFHLFGWDSEQVKANQIKKEALAKQEQWEQSVLNELRNDSIMIADWSPNMDLDRVDFIADVDTLKYKIDKHLKGLSSDEEIKEYLRIDVTAQRLIDDNKERLHSAIKAKKLQYLAKYIERFNSETGLHVSIERPDIHSNSRDWVILECVTSEHNLSENFIRQLSEEVGALGVKSISYGLPTFNDHPRRGQKEMTYTKHIQCVNFDSSEWQ